MEREDQFKSQDSDLSTVMDEGETEVVLERIHIAGDFEFYTYNANGEMALESEFPAGLRPSPITCVSCHLNSEGKAARFIRRQH